MDDLFHIVADTQIIVHSRGTYYQRKVYCRGDRLYAAHGGGFVRIGAGDATSNPNVSWESFDLPDGMKRHVKFEQFAAPTFVMNP